MEKSCTVLTECRKICDYYHNRYSEVLVENRFLDNYSAFILANPGKAGLLITPVKLDLGLSYLCSLVNSYKPEAELLATMNHESLDYLSKAVKYEYCESLWEPATKDASFKSIEGVSTFGWVEYSPPLMGESGQNWRQERGLIPDMHFVPGLDSQGRAYVRIEGASGALRGYHQSSSAKDGNRNLDQQPNLRAVNDSFQIEGVIDEAGSVSFKKKYINATIGDEFFEQGQLLRIGNEVCIKISNVTDKNSHQEHMFCFKHKIYLRTAEIQLDSLGTENQGYLDAQMYTQQESDNESIQASSSGEVTLTPDTIFLRKPQTEVFMTNWDSRTFGLVLQGTKVIVSFVGIIKHGYIQGMAYDFEQNKQGVLILGFRDHDVLGFSFIGLLRYEGSTEVKQWDLFGYAEGLVESSCGARCSHCFENINHCVLCKEPGDL